jgi:hypothetical protein
MPVGQPSHTACREGRVMTLSMINKNVLAAVFGGVWLVAGLEPGQGEALPILYNQTITQPLGLPMAVPTSRPTTDVGEKIQDPNESNCIAEEGCLGLVGAPGAPLPGFSPGFVVRMKAGGGFEFIDGGNMPAQITFEFPFPDGALNALIKNTPGFATLTVVAARDIDEGFAADEFLAASAEGIPLGILATFASPNPCPRPPHNVIEDPNRTPKVIVKDSTCGPNYHTDVTGTASLTFSQETMSQLLATPGPTDVFVNLAPGGSVARLQIFSVSLTYTAPAPNTLLLLVAGATIVGAAVLITTRTGRHKPEPGQS